MLPPQPWHFKTGLLAMARSVKRYSSLQCKHNTGRLKIMPVSKHMYDTPTHYPARGMI
jgi:hypothetical protein